MKLFQSWRQISLHLLFWFLYVLSEYLANLVHIDEGQGWNFIKLTLISIPGIMIPTYFIAFIAIPKFLRKNRLMLFWISILAAAIFTLYARIYGLTFINWIQYGEFFNIPVSKVLKNVIRDYAIISLAVCLNIIQEWKALQHQKEALIKANAQAELQLLKNQLHPHFLFNSLNNIYSLSVSGSPKTSESILKLTELLDYLVYWANKQTIPLEKEIELIKSYIGLEKLRYGDQLQIDSTFNIKNDKVLIAPVLLLPFLENCFKHGGVLANGDFLIILKLESDRNSLNFYLKNSKKKGGSPAGGIGLKNIEERLKYIYPKTHSLEISENADFFEIELKIRFDTKKT